MPDLEWDEEKRRTNIQKHGLDFADAKSWTGIPQRISRTNGRKPDAMASKRKNRAVPDDDIPEMTAADFAAARSLKTDMPVVVAATKRGRGRPKVERPKERVSLRIDPKIVAAYKATGKGWQSRINEVLAQALSGQRKRKRPSKAA
jgi:uncharacterized protein (DUF4415 family)